MKTAKPLDGITVGFDLDVAVYDVVRALQTIMVEEGHDPHSLPHAQEWNFFGRWGMIGKEFAALMEESIMEEELFLNPNYHLGTPHLVVDNLMELGAKCVVITDRVFGNSREESMRQTIEFVQEVLGIDAEDVHMTSNKTEIPVDFFVDDKPENCYALFETGVNVMLYSQPWNQHIRDLERVFTLTDFYEGILDISIQKNYSGL